MTAIACSLVALLLLQEASPATAGAGKCDLLDNRCKAKLYERKGAAADTPKLRALYLFVAHRSYLALYEQFGGSRDLCEARRLFDESLAVKDQPEGQRKSFEAMREELESQERERGVRCANPGKRPKKGEPPIVARTTASPVPRPGAAIAARGPEVATTAEAAGVTRGAPGPAAPPLIADTSNAPMPADALLPVRARNSDPPARPTAQPGDTTHRVMIEPRPGRRLVIAGGATLGVGLALTGIAGYMGGRLIQTNREAEALLGTIDGFADEDQLARNAELNRDYRRMGPQTLALALAGGTTVVVAVVLLGVGGRRMARVASRTALLPVPGGLAFHARF